MRNKVYLVPSAVLLLVASLTLALLASLAYAEDAPCDCKKPERDPSVWSKTIALGFNFTEGNSDTQLLNLNAKLGRDYQKNIWRFEVDGSHGKADSDENTTKETTQKDIKADAEYKRLLNKRWYVGFGNSFLYDGIADVDYRDTLKPVVGYFIIRKDDLRLSAETGPGYVFEKVDGETDNFFAPRVGERLEWDISKTSKLFQSAEYLWDISDSDNYLINAEAGLSAGIIEGVSLVVSIKDSYDNQPAKDSERNDVSIITGLQLSL